MADYYTICGKYINEMRGEREPGFLLLRLNMSLKTIHLAACLIMCSWNSSPPMASRITSFNAWHRAEAFAPSFHHRFTATGRQGKPLTPDGNLLEGRIAWYAQPSTSSHRHTAVSCRRRYTGTSRIVQVILYMHTESCITGRKARGSKEGLDTVCAPPQNGEDTTRTDLLSCSILEQFRMCCVALLLLTSIYTIE